MTTGKLEGFEIDGRILKQILDAIKSIRHGSVQIIIHDSKVVQVDRTEKLRFQEENRK